MKELICPITREKCLRESCAWFVKSGSTMLEGCAVVRIAAQTVPVRNSRA